MTKTHAIGLTLLLAEGFLGATGKNYNFRGAWEKPPVARALGGHETAPRVGLRDSVEQRQRDGGNGGRGGGWEGGQLALRVCADGLKTVRSKCLWI